MLELVELEGDHSEAERAELHAGERDPYESLHLAISWEHHERRIAIRDDGRTIASVGLIVAPVVVAGETFEVVGFGGVIVTRAPRRGPRAAGDGGRDRALGRARAGVRAAVLPA
jgi:hypothetical protein